MVESMVKPMVKSMAQLFQEALGNINMWYDHQLTTTWRPTHLPRQLSRAGYNASRTPAFQRAVASLISSEARPLDITADVSQRILLPWMSTTWSWRLHPVHIGHNTPEAALAVDAIRVHELIEGKICTNPSDKDKVVIPQYARTFNDAIHGAEILSFPNPGFTSGEAERVLDVALRHCTGM